MIMEIIVNNIWPHLCRKTALSPSTNTDSFPINSNQTQAPTDRLRDRGLTLVDNGKNKRLPNSKGYLM